MELPILERLPEDAEVTINAQTLSIIVSLAWEGIENLHELIKETEDDPDPYEMQAHQDYLERADQGLSAVLIAAMKLNNLVEENTQ